MSQPPKFIYEIPTSNLPFIRDLIDIHELGDFIAGWHGDMPFMEPSLVNEVYGVLSFKHNIQNFQTEWGREMHIYKIGNNYDLQEVKHVSYIAINRPEQTTTVKIIDDVMPEMIQTNELPGEEQPYGQFGGTELLETYKEEFDEPDELEDVTPYSRDRTQRGKWINKTQQRIKARRQRAITKRKNNKYWKDPKTGQIYRWDKEKTKPIDAILNADMNPFIKYPIEDIWKYFSKRK